MMKKRKSIFVKIIRLKNVLPIVFLLICSVVVNNFFYVAETNAESEIKLPVLMYHSVLDIPSRAGEYVITPKTLENDLQKIKELGYTTVNCKDLIDYVYQGKELPKKPVMLTFDDGNYNNYTYVYPLMEKYDMKCVISVVGEFSEIYSKENAVMNNKYSYLTYNQIKEMAESGRVEIGNHTYHMHNQGERKGVLRMKGEDAEVYKNTLVTDVEKLQDTLYQKSSVVPLVFAYPFGAVNDRAKSIIKELGFKVTLGCQEGINIINGVDSLYDIKRYNRGSNFDITKILN